MTPTRQTPLATAGEVVALLAAFVAALYVFGGTVLALRLLFEGFPLEAVVALVGQLPRELVITVGLLEAIAPAAVLGLFAGLAAGALNRPAPGRTDAADLKTSQAWPWLLVLLGLLAAALVAPGVLLVVATDGIDPLLLTSVLGWAVTYVLVVLGWYLLRRVGRASWSLLGRAAAAGAIWMGMALVGGVMVAAAVPLERASVCVKGTSAPKTGDLIADTKERVIMGASDGGRRVVNIPASEVRRVRYGNLPAGLPCD